jgi:pantetheine-phosphate adenylyltransferase
MHKQIKAMYPGSFDPIHAGHLDVIKRCSKIFDKLYVVVSINIYKNNSNTIQARLDKAKKVIQKLHLKNVLVISNEKLTTTFAKKNGISVIIRGIRNIKDTIYETNIAKANYRLNKSIETMFILPRKKLLNISSTAIKYYQDAKRMK